MWTDRHLQIGIEAMTEIGTKGETDPPLPVLNNSPDIPLGTDTTKPETETEGRYRPRIRRPQPATIRPHAALLTFEKLAARLAEGDPPGIDPTGTSGARQKKPPTPEGDRRPEGTGRPRRTT